MDLFCGYRTKADTSVIDSSDLFCQPGSADNGAFGVDGVGGVGNHRLGKAWQ